MTRRARSLVTFAAILAVALVALAGSAAPASAESLCTRVWVGQVNQRLCVPVP